MYRRSICTVLVLTIVVAGCGQSTTPESAAPTAEGAGEQPTIGAVPVAPSTTEAPAEASAAPQGEAGMTGEDFIAQAAALSGTEVTLARCSLMTEPSPDGDYACRVIDSSNADLKDPTGLPVDVFFSQAGLSAEDASWLETACPDAFCIVKLTGTLNVSPDTFFVEMTDVSLSEAGDAIQ